MAESLRIRSGRPSMEQTARQDVGGAHDHQGALGGARRRRRCRRASVAAALPGGGGRARAGRRDGWGRARGARSRALRRRVSRSVARCRGGYRSPAGDAAASARRGRDRRDGLRVDRERRRRGQARRRRLHSQAVHARSDPSDRESRGRGAAAPTTTGGTSGGARREWRAGGLRIAQPGLSVSSCRRQPRGRGIRRRRPAARREWHRQERARALDSREQPARRGAVCHRQLSGAVRAT